MQVEAGVSKHLKALIQRIMNDDAFKAFNLGGGTSLALKYNHRLSLDIDLFSPKVVGKEKMHELAKHIETNYHDIKPNVAIRNREDDITCWLQISTNLSCKIDIIQNLPLSHPLEHIDGIRKINDRDIAPLKMLAAADRGVRKDFYDLLLLSQEISLVEMHDMLLSRFDTFPADQYPNIFSPMGGAKDEKLRHDISALANYNNANDNSAEGNKILLTQNSPVDYSWFEAAKKWKTLVMQLAKQKNLQFSETKNKKLYRKKDGLNW
jgi:hypothetical protein